MIEILTDLLRDLWLVVTGYQRLKKKSDQVMEKIGKNKTCTADDYIIMGKFCKTASSKLFRERYENIFLCMALSGSDTHVVVIKPDGVNGIACGNTVRKRDGEAE